MQLTLVCSSSRITGDHPKVKSHFIEQKQIALPTDF